MLHTYKNQELQHNTNGVTTFNSSNFSGDSYVNFLLGMASYYDQLEYLAGKHWVNNNYSGYVNDNWHVSPRLVLNLGLRYDGLPHAFERYDKFSNFVPADYDRSLGNPLNPDGTLNPAFLSTFPGTGHEQFYLNGIREAGVNGFPRGNVEDHYYTLQPRVGFAWDMSGNGKTVLRGGYGLFYERVQGNDVYNAALNPPFAYIPSATNVYFSNPNTSVLTGATTLNHFPSSLTNIKYDYPLPGTENYSLGIQRELAPSIIAVVQYVGSTGFSQNNDRADQHPAAARSRSCRLSTATSPYYDPRQTGRNWQSQREPVPHLPGLCRHHPGRKRDQLQLQLAPGRPPRGEPSWAHHPGRLHLVAPDEHRGQRSQRRSPTRSMRQYDWGSDTGFDRRQILNVSYVYNLPWFNKSSNTRCAYGTWRLDSLRHHASSRRAFRLASVYSGSDVLGLGRRHIQPSGPGGEGQKYKDVQPMVQHQFLC